jgi:Ca2+-binding RTX toxin-like protein
MNRGLSIVTVVSLVSVLTLGSKSYAGDSVAGTPYTIGTAMYVCQDANADGIPESISVNGGAMTPVTPNSQVTIGGVTFCIGTTGSDVIDESGPGGISPAVFFGGPGADQLTGGNAGDNFHGGGGGDTITGNGGDDNAWGGTGNDTANGGAGDDNLRGEEGSDALNGDDDTDILDGGLNGDTLHGGDGTDFADGGQGNDEIYGDAGDDVLADNGYGNDVDHIYGGDGADDINSGDGDSGGSGADNVDCGANDGDQDRIIYDSSDGVDHEHEGGVLDQLNPN